MDILFTLLMFLPMVIVLWLANLSHRKRIEGEIKSERMFKLLAYGLLFLIYGGLFVLGLLFQGLDLLIRLGLSGDASDLLAISGMSAEALPWMALGFWAPSLLGLILLTRPARRLFARFTSIDPANPVHAVALSMTALIAVNLLVTLGLGLGNLAEALESSAATGSVYDPLPGLWAQNITFLLMALVGVGLFARRTLRGALNRLGIVKPTLVQVLIGVGAGLLLVPAVLLLEAAASKLGIGASPDVERLTEQLIGPLTTSSLGVMTLGLAAALGEESIFRGALQPKFSLLLTTLLFALLHSQYGISFSTVAVFLVGLVLGLLRLRANTSTSMITHAVYNMSLGLISYLGWLQSF